jgi:F-type H+-transporting ATPase subunit epsilon
MAAMQVEVVSAEAQLYSGEADEVYARTTEGEIGILPGHQPILASLEIAPVRLKTAEGETEVFAVHNGTIFYRDDHLVVLADRAEHADEIDVERARQQQERLESEGDLDEVKQKALRRARTRLRIAQGDTWQL